MSKNLSPREAALAAIDRQHDHVDRLTLDWKAGRISEAAFDEGIAHLQQLHRNAYNLPDGPIVSSSSDPVVRGQKSGSSSQRRSAPGTGQPSLTLQRAKAAKAAKELTAWHQRRAAKAAQALAELESRLTTR